MRPSRSSQEWSVWEKRIQGEANLQGIECSRIPEVIRGLYTQHPVKVKSDVDFVLGLDGKAVWLDAKTCQEPLWNIKHYVFRNDKHASKIHQWAKLLSAYQRGNHAGYLIWFSELRKITWVPVSAIEWAVKDGRPSIHPESPLCTSQSDDTQIFFRKLILGVK